MTKLNDQQFEEQVLNTPGLKAVKFGAIWCGPCRVLTQKLKVYDNNQNIPIYEMNIDDSRKYPDMYNIKSIPELIIFKDGKIEERFSQDWHSDNMLEVIFKKYSLEK